MYSMPTDKNPPVVDVAVVQLQAAALAAVCAVSSEHIDAGHDPNPYTHQLTAYDLGRLFNFDPSARPAMPPPASMASPPNSAAIIQPRPGRTAKSNFRNRHSWGIISTH